MICISIAQESRRLALVDMLNASRQCDLLEIRLDLFGRAPEIQEILAAKPKPIIMTNRRKQDGGAWDGSEEERLAILRQCIIAKADYVEIELDIADQIRPFPGCKRVISYTNLEETPSDIADIYAQCQTKKPDIIKLTTLARSPEEAWPLLQIVAKATIPTVIVGLGRPGVMLAVLGKRAGAPWTYAALEKGMEAHPDQPTVNDLRRIYHYESIEKKTRFVGVTGLSKREEVTVAVFNNVFAQLGSPFRCLPLAVGNAQLFRKVIDAVKTAAVVVGEEDRRDLFEIAVQPDATSSATRTVELLIQKNDIWHGVNQSYRGAIEALEATLRARNPSPTPLQGRMVAVVGTNHLARAIAEALHAKGAGVIIVSRDKTDGHQLAQSLGCRFALFEAVYSTAHDVLIVCEIEKMPLAKPGGKATEGIHPGYLKNTLTVMDLTSGLEKSSLLKEAEVRGSGVVSPRQLFMSQLQRQVRLLLGKEPPPDAVTVVFNSLLPEEE